MIDISILHYCLHICICLCVWVLHWLLGAMVERIALFSHGASEVWIVRVSVQKQCRLVSRRSMVLRAIFPTFSWGMLCVVVIQYGPGHEARASCWVSFFLDSGSSYYGGPSIQTARSGGGLVLALKRQSGMEYPLHPTYIYLSYILGILYILYILYMHMFVPLYPNVRFLGSSS